MPVALDHIHLRCQDPEGAAEFYVKLLGGEVVKRLEVRGLPIVQVRVGNIVLSLSPQKEGLEVKTDPDDPHWGVYQIGLRVENMAGTIKELKAKGAQFAGPPMEVGSGIKVVFLKAPDGVEIELMHFPEQQ